MRGRSPFKLVLTGVGAALPALFLFTLLCPYLEESRAEARIHQSYIEVRKLHHELSQQTEVPPEVLPQKDPWDTPYRTTFQNKENIRVFSFGPNKSGSSTGLDEDDIYSDMPHSPIAAILTNKQRQLTVAFMASAGTWMLLLHSLPIEFRSTSTHHVG